MPHKKSNNSKKYHPNNAYLNYFEQPTTQGWSASRADVSAKEKINMARHFILHDLFVQEDKTPGDERKNTVAKIIVNPGTTTNEVVKQVMEWIKNEVENNPNHAAPRITWYTPGSLVPATLLSFRLAHPLLRNSCGLHMFPGMVDPDLEMVRGTEPVQYARQLEKCFTYSFLSPYAFDMDTGTAFSFFDEEVELQREIAIREATHKFLFLDPEKFKRDGSKVYLIKELLRTSRNVTIYTVSSKKDSIIKKQFEDLAEKLIDTKSKKESPRKIFRLVIVCGEKQINIPYLGELRSDGKETGG